MRMPELQLDAVFVGQPRLLATGRGQVESGIAKHRVPGPWLRLDPTNLEGDRQADTSVHGGPDKAVYAYPAEHYGTWRDEGVDVGVGGVGENLSVRGGDEGAVRVGSVWAWGEALVQVTQPRSPCYKLAAHTGRRDIGPRLLETARSGWYLRVLQPGVVPTSGRIVLEEDDPAAPTVAEALDAMFGTDRTLARRVADNPVLAAQWRKALIRKLER